VALTVVPELELACCTGATGAEGTALEAQLEEVADDGFSRVEVLNTVSVTVTTLAAGSRRS